MPNDNRRIPTLAEHHKARLKTRNSDEINIVKIAEKPKKKPVMLKVDKLREDTSCVIL